MKQIDTTLLHDIHSAKPKKLPTETTPEKIQSST